MSGDRPGSPRRDERQSFASEEPWSYAAPAAETLRHAEPFPPAEPFPGEPFSSEPFPGVPGQAAPSGDDVKVAGAQHAAAAVPAGDTLGLQPVPGESATGTGAMASLGMGAPGLGTEVLDAPGEHRDEVAFGAGSEPGRRSAGPRRLGGSRSSRRSSGPKPGGGRNGLKIAAVVAGALVVVGGGGAAFAMSGGSGDDGAKTVQPKLADAAAAPKVDPMVMEQMRRKEAYERASRATREDPANGLKLRAKGHPIPKPTPTKSKDSGSGSGSGAPSGDPVPAGEAQAIAKRLLPSYGMGGSGQFGCLVNLWNKESHWNTHAANPSGAYGIPQALPGSKMASAGPDWQNNATTQIKWGLGYIKDRYSTPCGAWAHSESSGWY
ncbi:aggregation-promoting factor C-terminal-like domain-containing protein [Actinomadura opuntiae]|uniref:aggregation-promoting factor C-terminal-like domain-containing protein n=1 Tax=Actinomadura sp. OS1-43 TaxID=604315 RepID=UPI00255A7CAF|nr:hypothetical protein [Actinomadura sp. OS1-43]MDL4815752.1 hypothetical protein [Actinomadura sp. OS1-43]